MWTEMLHDSTVENELKEAIKHFFIPDNIDFNKFMNNFLANKICEQMGFGIADFLDLKQNGLLNENNIFINAEMLSFIERVELDKPDTTISCTPTFLKYYSEKGIIRKSELGEWFYIAYPDVAVWFEDNFELFKRELQREYYFGVVPIVLYKLIIERYKAQNKPLECSND
jgi:hypothetical protein